MVVAVAAGLFLGLGNLGDQRLRREQERRHAGGILEGRPHHLRGVDHAGTHQIAILFFVGVVAVVLALHVPDAIDHHRTVDTGIRRDRLERISQGILHDRRPELFVAFEVEFVQGFLAPQQGDAAARHDAFREGRLRRALGVFDECLPLLHLRLSRRSDADLGNSTGQFRQPLLKLLAVVVAGGLRDLLADLGRTAVDGRFRAAATHDRGVLSLDDHLLGPAQVRQLHSVEGDAEILEDRLAAGEHGEVAKDRLAAVAVAGSLHGHALHDAAQFVDHERGERLALHVFGDHDERLARLADRFEQRHEVFGAGDLLLEQEDRGIFEFAGLRVGVGHEVRREEAAIELHAFHHVDRGLGLLALFDGDHAVFSDLEDRLCKHVADRRIVVACDRGDLHQLFLVLFVDRGGHRQDRLRDRLDGLVDAAGERHRVGPRGDHLQAFAKDRLGQHGGRGGAVAGHVVGLARRFLHELGAEILVGIFEIDVFSDRDAVLGDLR